jgi:hypothetical protein
MWPPRRAARVDSGHVRGEHPAFASILAAEAAPNGQKSPPTERLRAMWPRGRANCPNRGWSQSPTLQHGVRTRASVTHRTWHVNSRMRIKVQRSFPDRLFPGVPGTLMVSALGVRCRSYVRTGMVGMLVFDDAHLPACQLETAPVADRPRGNEKRAPLDGRRGTKGAHLRASREECAHRVGDQKRNPRTKRRETKSAHHGAPGEECAHGTRAVSGRKARTTRSWSPNEKRAPRPRLAFVVSSSRRSADPADGYV